MTTRGLGRKKERQKRKKERKKDIYIYISIYVYIYIYIYIYMRVVVAGVTGLWHLPLFIFDNLFPPMLNFRKTHYSDAVFLKWRRNIIFESVVSVLVYPLFHLSFSPCQFYQIYHFSTHILIHILWKMEMCPTVCKYENMKKQDIQMMYLFIHG